MGILAVKDGGTAVAWARSKCGLTDRQMASVKHLIAADNAEE